MHSYFTTLYRKQENRRAKQRRSSYDVKPVVGLKNFKYIVSIGTIIQMEFRRKSILSFFKAMGILLTPPSICPSSVRLSLPVKLSLFLNHLAEFYQTCYITSPHGKGVREQVIFLCVRPCVRRPSICLSHYLLLHHWAEFNQTCYFTSPHGMVVRHQPYFSVHLPARASVARPCVRHAISS